MKRVIIFFALMFLMSPAMAETSADGPQDILSLVGSLQKNPHDDDLRRKIIVLAREAKPEILEEARRYFVKGTTHAKSANKPEEQKRAIKSFKEALNLAPWWGDAYYNLAIAQELAGEYREAGQSLAFYIQTSPGKQESRDAQDHIYALEAKQETANEKAKFKVQSPDPASKAAENSIDGAVFIHEVGGGTAAGVATRWTLEITGDKAKLTIQDLWFDRPAEVLYCTIQRRKCEIQAMNAYANHVIEISKDGKSAASVFYTPSGSVGDRRAYRRVR
jgi:tetratricopeptide (TPR) repeat protein